jgi:ribulose kinase
MKGDRVRPDRSAQSQHSDPRALTPGQLIDFVITTHPAYPELRDIAKKNGKSIHAVLAEKLDELKREAGVRSLTRLTKDLHFYPDLHGTFHAIFEKEWLMV